MLKKPAAQVDAEIALSVAVDAAKRAGGRYVETQQGPLALDAFAKLPARKFPRGVVSYEYTAPASIDRIVGTHGSIQMINRQGNIIARTNVLKEL